MGLRTRPSSSTARSPTPSDWKVQRCRYARHAAARGIATQTRSAASWYAIACRSASVHRCIFISIAVTVVPHEPTRSARRPRIGTSTRTSNPASRSQVATGSRRSDSRRNTTIPHRCLQWKTLIPGQAKPAHPKERQRVVVMPYHDLRVIRHRVEWRGRVSGPKPKDCDESRDDAERNLREHPIPRPRWESEENGTLDGLGPAERLGRASRTSRHIVGLTDALAVMPFGELVPTTLVHGRLGRDLVVRPCRVSATELSTLRMQSSNRWALRSNANDARPSDGGVPLRPGSLVRSRCDRAGYRTTR